MTVIIFLILTAIINTGVVLFCVPWLIAGYLNVIQVVGVLVFVSGCLLFAGFLRVQREE